MGKSSSGIGHTHNFVMADLKNMGNLFVIFDVPSLFVGDY